ncbi:MAG: hypothetical protein RLZZ15_3104 [Verrucomicrobiota bacterium]|jgi:urease accessory protein UreH
MTTTVHATYDEGVLKLRRHLPLPPQSAVLVTVEMPGLAVNGDPVAPDAVTWPDVSARLRELYGATVLPENPVLAARNDERF